VRVRSFRVKTDDQVVQSLIAETKQCFPGLYSCSFDKAFHSPDNQKVLNQILDVAALPRKGRLSQTNAEHERSEPTFRGLAQDFMIFLGMLKEETRPAILFDLKERVSIYKLLC